MFVAGPANDGLDASCGPFMILLRAVTLEQPLPLLVD